MVGTAPLDHENAPRLGRESSPAVGLRVAVARIYRSLRINTERRVTPSQTSALARLEQAGPLRLGVLAQMEGIAAASMSKIVESLEAQSLVERVTDPLDGRVSIVSISASGRDVIQEMRTASTHAIEVALAALSAEERLVIHDSLPVLEKLSELLQRNHVDA